MIIKTFKTKELTPNNIRQICKIKSTHWKYSIKSQLEFFKNIYKPNDIHICVIFLDKIVAYNCLRKRNIIISNRSYKYLLFDALIVSKKFRGKGLSKLLMLFNNIYINKMNLVGFLLCGKKLLKFYMKYGWSSINLSKIIIKDISRSKSAMMCNKIAIKGIDKNLNNGKIIIDLK